MFKVTKKPKTPNILWDASNNRPLYRFVKGVFETNDEAIASKLKDLGYTVTGEVDKVEPETPNSDGEADADAPDDSKGDGEGAATPEADAEEQKADGETDAEKSATKSRRSRK